MLQPEKTTTDFHELLLKPIADSTDGHPPNLTIQVYSEHSKYTYAEFMIWLIRSCTHAVKAHVADEAGLQAKAWSHTANAQYHLGLLEGTLILEPALEHIISARSTSGAKKRNEKYEPVRELARELAVKKYYPSKRQAALGIKKEILEKAKEHGLVMSEFQAERTITGWLDGMTFTSKHRTSTT